MDSIVPSALSPHTRPHRTDDAGSNITSIFDDAPATDEEEEDAVVASLMVLPWLLLLLLLLLLLFIHVDTTFGIHVVGNKPVLDPLT